MKIKLFGLCMAVIMEVAAGAKEVQGRAKEIQGRAKVRFRPYFKNAIKGTNEFVQFYKAIYPADYSDLSMLKLYDLQKMAAVAEGPEDTPVFVKVDDDTYFGRSRECRETKMTDHELARRCARADIHLLGIRHATLYTVWNLFVYFHPILVFFVTAWTIFFTFHMVVQLTQFFVRLVSSFRVSNRVLIGMMNSSITNILPGSYMEGGTTFRWNPEQMEILRRLRLKIYYSYLMRKDGGRFIEGMQLDLPEQENAANGNEKEKP